MIQDNNSNIDQKDAQPGELSIFGRIKTYWRMVGIQISIDRELAQTILRSRAAFQALSGAPSKKVLGNRAKAEASRREHLKKFAGKTLPSVLTTKRQLTFFEKLWNLVHALQARLVRTSISIKRRFVPNQDDLAILAELRIENHMAKVAACQHLIEEAMSREQDLRVEAQKKRRDADKLLRRAARQKDKNHPVIKKASEINQYVETLERSASKYAEIQKLRLPILKARLAKLEAQWQDKRAELQARRAQLITSQAKMADELIKRSSKSGAGHVHSRMEKRIVELEAKVAGALMAQGGAFKLPSDFFEPMEKKIVDLEARVAEALMAQGEAFKLPSDLFEPMESKVAGSEALAKISADLIANRPGIEIETMGVAELKDAQAAFERAVIELLEGQKELLAIENRIGQSLLDLEDSVEVWSEREQLAEKQGSTDIAHQSRMRKTVYLDLTVDLKAFLDGHRPKTEAVSQMLKKIEEVSLKIAARLKDVDPSN